MIRIAVLDDYLHTAQASVDWGSLDGAQVDFFHDTLLNPKAVAARLAPYDVLITTRERTRLPAEALEQMPNLKLIAGSGRRQANVDMDAANRLGILVCTTGGGGQESPINSTAELAWGLIIALFRHIPWEDRQIREGRWQTRVGTGLGGKTLGILGMGRLGSQVAKLGGVFGMNVIAWGPTLTAERAAAGGATYVTWDGLFSQSDVVSIHVPLTDLSRGWVTAREFSLMKPTAYLVNTSRGPIVQKHALLEALRDHKIAGAALDVYDEEPIPAYDPLLSYDNVILTPHLGYATKETLAHFFEESLENVRQWMAGSPQNVYNPEVLPSRR